MAAVYFLCGPVGQARGTCPQAAAIPSPGARYWAMSGGGRETSHPRD